MANTYVPPWRPYEKDLSSNDIEVAEKAGDGFEKERARELQTSSKAQSWEEGRKKEIATVKPDYIKRRNAAKIDPATKTLALLKDGGTYEGRVIPSPGFILVEPEPLKQQERAGFVLPEAKGDTSNTGTVVEIGQPLVTITGEKITFAHPQGSRVIVRKFAPYIDIITNGKKCQLLQFNDVLGRIE